LLIPSFFTINLLLTTHRHRLIAITESIEKEKKMKPLLS